MLASRRVLGSTLRRSGLLTSGRAMATIPFKLADIGEGIAEVELLKWFVKEGDVVKSFDRICEVQSDKATVEITSRYDGLISKVHYEEGAIVPVGSSLVDIATEGGDEVAESTTTGSSEVAVTASAASITVTAATSGGKVLTTPAVRKIAKENSIDLSKVPATGPKGRLVKEDVLNYIKNGGVVAAAAPAAAAPAAAAAAPVAASTACPLNQQTSTVALGEDVRVPIRGVQRMMVKSMTAANNVQHLTLCEEIIFDRVRELRSSLKGPLSKQGVKLSYMPILIKATSMALTKFPQLNSTVNADCSEVIYHASHNIGIAMDTPKGLVVPVIKAVQTKSIATIARELNELQALAAAGTLNETHLSGGTFSLSNIGSVAGTYATPVLVVPQVAIGALGRSQIVPRYVNKNGVQASLEEIDDGEATIQPQTIMNVSWSADHRVIDGASVARFSNTWKSYLENPETMIAEMH